MTRDRWIRIAIELTAATVETMSLRHQLTRQNQRIQQSVRKHQPTDNRMTTCCTTIVDRVSDLQTQDPYLWAAVLRGAH